MLAVHARIGIAKECAAILRGKHGDAAVDNFVENVGEEMISLLKNSLGTKTQTHSKRREKMWTLFYKFRTTNLIYLWKRLLTQLGLPQKYEDPWLVQVLSRLMLNSAIKYCLPPATLAADLGSETVTADEHNALRYAAGYVMHSLKKKYATTNPSVVSWINELVDTGSDEGVTSFFQFTKLWVEKVNRGGLFLVNDSLYEVFLAMEIVLRKFLKSIASDHRLDKDRVSAIISEDNEIHFHWSMMSFDLDEETSQSVFSDIMKLWITIRGFAYASAIVDEYKRSSGLINKRKKALRKELKKKASDKK